MLIVGENIHIISPRVKQAFAQRDTKFVQDLAQKQVAAGAKALDLNIGPQKKEGPQVMEWLVNAIQEVVDVPLSFDTTNLAAIEVGLKRAKKQAIVNSTSAEPERLANVPPLAAKYNAKLIALCMGKSGIPVSADERVNIALEQLIPRAQEVGIPMENLYLDPLVMTVSGCQEYAPEAVEVVRTIKQAIDPPPQTICGLSNISNRVPPPDRPLINRVYLVMLMAVGLDAAIADPLDAKLWEFIRIVENRDASTPVGRLVLKLHDCTAAMEDLQDVDTRDPEQVAIWKTYQVLKNRVIYTDSYLRL